LPGTQVPFLEKLGRNIPQAFVNLFRMDLKGVHTGSAFVQ
jgi:hypothetical protein